MQKICYNEIGDEIFSRQVGCSVCCWNVTGEYFMMSASEDLSLASYLFQLKESKMGEKEGRTSRWPQVDYFSALSLGT